MATRATKTADVQRVALYARVSTTEQAEKDLSLPAQLHALRRMARDRGWEIAGEYVEPGASGRDDNRPEFRRMMRDVLAPSADVDAIVVVHTSRFMRDAAKSIVHKQALGRRGVRVISANQETSDDPSGRLMETIYAGFDQYESEMNGYRTSAAMRENARRGFVNGSAAPFGYRAELVATGHGPKRRRLVPEPEEGDIERRIARWQEAFETSVDSADVVLPRIRELQAKRWELVTALSKVVAIRPPPAHLYAETTIRRFQQTVRDLFLSADTTLAKNYLRFLVDQITVRGNELEIRGKTNAAVALLASPPDASPACPVKPAEAVLASAGCWLRKPSHSRTLSG